MSKHKFIHTSDNKTKQHLLQLGFQLISENGNINIFLNNSNFSFDEKKLKLKYSNQLYV